MVRRTRSAGRLQVGLRLCKLFGWKRPNGEGAALAQRAFSPARGMAGAALVVRPILPRERRAFRELEAWIGWDRHGKAQRLHLVVTNARFLVLQGERALHLASRVLAANLRRLSRDWEHGYGHPVLLAETFVDRSRFAGTCYRASNWESLGFTKGFGSPKAVVGGAG